MQKAEEVAADLPEVADDTMLSQEMLRKYITFAKQNCHPRLANANVEKISEVSCTLPCQQPIAMLLCKAQPLTSSAW